MPRPILTTAQAHMAYDKTLLNDHPEFIHQFYTWPQPAITYSYKQTLPHDLLPWDHSQRFTGGGIVFHCPGDIVGCCIATIHHPHFPQRLKDKVQVLQHHIQHTLTQHGYPVSPKQTTQVRNLDFCQTYDSPYELYYKNQKIVALSIRRTRSHFMIQSIIHLASTHDHFNLPAHYHELCVTGLPLSPSDQAPLRHQLQLSFDSVT